MTERDKIRICKALTKRLANIDINASDINITEFKYHTVINREGYKQQWIKNLEFNNGTISFAYFTMLNSFVIYPNLQGLEGCSIDSDITYDVYVNEITRYFDGKPRYTTQMRITYTPLGEEPYTIGIF